MIPQLRGAAPPPPLRPHRPPSATPAAGERRQVWRFPRREGSLPAHEGLVSTTRATALGLWRRFPSPARTRGNIGLRLSPEPRDPEAAAAPRGPPRSVSWGPVPRGPRSVQAVHPSWGSRPGTRFCPLHHELPPLLPRRVTRAGARETRREDCEGPRGRDRLCHSQQLEEAAALFLLVSDV